MALKSSLRENEQPEVRFVKQSTSIRMFQMCLEMP